MPWQEVTTMAARREFCELADREGANVSELARRFGISRKTGYKWLARWRTEGDAGLGDRSRQPHTSPARTDPAVEARVLALREEQPVWGGRKLRRRLQDLGEPTVPAASTCTAILRRHGRLDPAQTAKHTAWQRFAHPAPNDLWQMDFKGEVPLADGACHPLMVLDDHSRFAVGLVACANEQTATVQTALTALFRRYGLPWRLLCDNGPPWGTPVGPLTLLGAWLIRLGIGLRHGHPYHPQTQGKAERYGRTLGAEVLARTDLRDLAGAQAAFDHWREVYNLQRPHEALALATPASRYVVSPRPFPDELPPIVYEPGDAVRLVQASGTIDFRGHTWFVSEALRGQPVALRPTAAAGVVEVYFCHARVRGLDLDAPEEEC
jgi:transposase InsO family protein